MYHDTFGRLDAGAYSRAVATALSDNYIDMLKGTGVPQLGEVSELFGNFTITEAFAGPDGMMVEFQLLGMPVVAPARGTLSIATAKFTIADELIESTAHGLKTGTPIVFTDGSGSSTVPTGVTFGLTYFVIESTADKFYIAATLEDALDGTEVAMSGANSSGVVTATYWPHGLTRVVTAATTDLFTLTAHGMATGTPVRFITGDSGVVPTGITEDIVYFVVSISADTFKIATTLANALLPTPSVVDLTVASTATLVMQMYPSVIGSSGPIHKALLGVGSVIPVRANGGIMSGGALSVAGNSGTALKVPSGRYLYGRTVVVNADGTRSGATVAATAGKYLLDLNPASAGSAHQHYPGAFTIL